MKTCFARDNSSYATDDRDTIIVVVSVHGKLIHGIMTQCQVIQITLSAPSGENNNFIGTIYVLYIIITYTPIR